MTEPSPLLLIDSDIFGKLGATHLFVDAVVALGAFYDQCRRIRALPHMLRKGSFREHLGPEFAKCLGPLVNSIAPITNPSTDWLDPLRTIPGIDPGEAMLFAAAAEDDQQRSLILTGDKQAVVALKDVVPHRDRLRGRIVTLEAVLIHLLDELSEERLRHDLEPVRHLDGMLGICLNPENPDLLGCLRSYFLGTVKDVEPLVLWHPPARIHELEARVYNTDL